MLISTDGLGYKVEKKVEKVVAAAPSSALDPHADLAAIRAEKRRREVEAMSSGRSLRHAGDDSGVFSSAGGFSDLDAAAAAEPGMPKTKLSLRDQLAANKAAHDGLSTLARRTPTQPEALQITRQMAGPHATREQACSEKPL